MDHISKNVNLLNRRSIKLLLFLFSSPSHHYFTNLIIWLENKTISQFINKDFFNKIRIFQLELAYHFQDLGFSKHIHHTPSVFCDIGRNIDCYNLNMSSVQ